MTNTRWTPIDDALPASGVLVKVITPGGDERWLRYDDNLWWLPDMSMYCYFTPVFWRYSS